MFECEEHINRAETQEKDEGSRGKMRNRGEDDKSKQGSERVLRQRTGILRLRSDASKRKLAQKGSEIKVHQLCWGEAGQRLGLSHKEYKVVG